MPKVEKAVDTTASDGVYSIKATSKKMADAGVEPITITYNLGKDIYDAIDKFGEKVVWSFYKRQAYVSLQDGIRRHAVNETKDSEGNVTVTPGKSPEEIQDYYANFKFSEVTVRGKSKVEKASALVGDVDELAELEKLEAAIAAQKAKIQGRA